MPASAARSWNAGSVGWGIVSRVKLASVTGAAAAVGAALGAVAGRALGAAAAAAGGITSAMGGGDRVLLDGGVLSKVGGELGALPGDAAPNSSLTAWAGISTPVKSNVNEGWSAVPVTVTLRALFNSWEKKSPLIWAGRLLRLLLGRYGTP